MNSLSSLFHICTVKIHCLSKYAYCALVLNTALYMYYISPACVVNKRENILFQYTSRSQNFSLTASCDFFKFGISFGFLFINQKEKIQGN